MCFSVREERTHNEPERTSSTVMSMFVNVLGSVTPSPPLHRFIGRKSLLTRTFQTTASRVLSHFMPSNVDLPGPARPGEW